jgi:hypothetical protein
MGLFSTLKQVGLTAALRHLFRKHLERYATMPELHLHLAQNRVEGNILLRGETVPIHFSAHFELQDGSQSAPSAPPMPAASPPMSPGSPTITLSQISLSREWMQLLAQDFVANRPIPLPPDAAKWLRRLGEL